MAKYLCQMKDYDQDDDWTEIESGFPDIAAIDYAELCDSRSGGEMCNSMGDTQIILVKLGEAAPMRFEISAEYSKNFYASELEAISEGAESWPTIS